MAAEYKSLRKRRGGTSWNNRLSIAKCCECGTERCAYWKTLPTASADDSSSATNENQRKATGEKGPNDPSSSTSPNSQNAIGKSLVCPDCYQKLSRKKQQQRKGAISGSNEDQNPAVKRVKDHSRNSSEERMSAANVVSRRGSSRPPRTASASSANLNAQPQQSGQLTASASTSSLSSVGKLGSSRFSGRYAGAVSRRSQLFKYPATRRPVKAPSRQASIKTSSQVWLQDRCFTVGDIVCVYDESDPLPYYAQIRGLLTDSFAQRFATLVWLLPTQSAPLDRSFDAQHYVYGPNDETLYPLDCLEYLCTAPSPQFKLKWTLEEALKPDSEALAS